MNCSPKHWTSCKTTAYFLSLSFFNFFVSLIQIQCLALHWFMELCCLISFFKISVYLLLPLKWSANDTCIPPPSHFLTYGYLLRTLNNSNFFRFAWRFELSGVNLACEQQTHFRSSQARVNCTLVVLISDKQNGEDKNSYGVGGGGSELGSETVLRTFWKTWIFLKFWSFPRLRTKNYPANNVIKDTWCKA